MNKYHCLIALLVINFQNYEHVSLIVRSKGGGYVCEHSFQTRPGSRPKSRVLTGSPDQFFFLNQNNVVLVKNKNKNQQVATGFLTGSRRIFPSPIFSSTRPGSSPESTRRAEFQNYSQECTRLSAWSNSSYKIDREYIYLFLVF